MSSSTAPAATSTALTWKRVAQFVVGMALAAVLLIWGVPHFGKTSWADVFEVLKGISLAKFGLFQLLMLLGLYCYTFTLTGALPGLSHGKALIMNLCGSSVSNLLPGGGAVGLAATYAMARSWGFSHRSTSTSAIVTGVWNVLSRIALPPIAIVALWFGAKDTPPTLTEAALAGFVSGALLLGLFVAVLASERAAQAVGRGVDRLVHLIWRRGRRSPRRVSELVHDMRARVLDVVRDHWLSMTLGMVGFFGFYYVLFVFIMRTTGLVLPLGILFAAFAVGRILTTVGVTPGGLGLTETATTAALVGWGASPADAAAGVVLFSIFTHLMEVPLGALGWVLWSVSPKSTPPDETPASAPATSPHGREDPEPAG